MNEVLRGLAVEAGAPKEVINELWFNIFCKNFAHLILEMVEESEE